VEGVVSRIGTAPGLAVLIAVLCVFGLIMVGSASPLISMQLYGSPWSILIRQSLWMGVGAGVLVLTYKMDYRKWRKARGPLVVVTMGLLFAVLVPHLGVSAGGSSRWIGVGPLQLQPSELMKLALAVFAADLVTRRSHLMSDPKLVVVPVLAVLGISGVLILKQPDMGTALVLCCIAFGVLFIGGVPMGPILKIVGVFGGLAVVVGLADPYRRDRILAFLNPGATRSGTGYQVWQSLIGLGSGHLFGLGLGGGREKWGTLPNAHTDFIFSVVGEELGLVGAVAVLGLFFALAWFGLRAATRAPDRFGSLLAVGITTWITSQAVINIGAVIGVLPVTGIPLPFISFGGSSLVITMAAAGILVNIASRERSTTASNGLRLRPSRR
jgi:cell division protein FtsW